MNCLNASTDKVKQQNWDFRKDMDVAAKMAFLRLVSPAFIRVNFIDTKLTLRPQ